MQGRKVQLCLPLPLTDIPQLHPPHFSLYEGSDHVPPPDFCCPLHGPQTLCPCPRAFGPRATSPPLSLSPNGTLLPTAPCSFLRTLGPALESSAPSGRGLFGSFKDRAQGWAPGALLIPDLHSSTPGKPAFTGRGPRRPSSQSPPVMGEHRFPPGTSPEPSSLCLPPTRSISGCTGAGPGRPPPPRCPPNSSHRRPLKR